MKLKVIPNTATVIPPLVFEAAPPFAYPSGGNPGGLMVITPSQIAAFNSVQNGPVPIPAGPMVGEGAVVDVVTCPITLIGGKQLSIAANIGPLALTPGIGTSALVCTLQLLVGATVVRSYPVQEIGIGDVPPPIPSFGLAGLFSPTVAGPTNVILRLINFSVDGSMPEVPTVMLDTTGFVSASEF